MSNPTGDALHAEGLEDKGGVIRPIGEKDAASKMKALLAKMQASLDALFARRATNQKIA